jgi:hypothetical protein
MAHEDTRSEVPTRVVILAASGDTIRFEQDNQHFCARVGASTTAVACPAYTALPIGLRFTLDNSNGSGGLTLTPTAGTPIVVPALQAYDCLVTASGAIKAGELAAAPT